MESMKAYEWIQPSAVTGVLKPLGENEKSKLDSLHLDMNFK